MEKQIKVILRKPHKGQYSLEKIFNALNLIWQDQAQLKLVNLPKLSKGIKNLLLNGFYIYKSRGTVNHITGDCHYIAFFLKKKGTILTIHDCDFINRASGLKRRLLKFFWLQGPINRSSVVTTISKASAEEISKLSHYPIEKIKVIPNPLLSGFDWSEKAFNSSYPRILQIGTKKNKNLYRLIQALSEIPCHLDIIGPLDDDLLQLLKRTQIDYSQSQYLSDEEVRQKYFGCDMLTLVSTEEGFGLPIIEANAIGRVVVTSNISSMPEVADGAACLVDPFQVSSIRSGIQR